MSPDPTPEMTPRPARELPPDGQVPAIRLVIMPRDTTTPHVANPLF